MSPRYAIYYAPAVESALWRLGSSTIGYDAATGEATSPDVEPAFADAEWRLLTEAPRRYGFHATLKAPFALRDGLGLPQVVAAATALAGGIGPVPLLRLDVRLLDGFTALVPDGSVPRLRELEGACLDAFEPLRAALGEGDRARRLGAGLTPRQIAYLDRFGYPYVKEEFRLHLTLTGSLAPALREPVRAFLAERFRNVTAGAVIDAITIFGQEGRSAPFRILERVPLRGAS